MRPSFIPCISILLAFFTWTARAADSAVSDADGVVTWTPADPGTRIQGKYKPTRWGMYDVEAKLQNAAAGRVKLAIAGKEFASACDATSPTVKLGRLYFDTAAERPLVVEAEPADAGKPLVIASIVFTPAPEGKPIVQADDLSITLHARDATVHGVNLRYEFRPDKNTLGFWSKPTDWVSWDFELKKSGKFIVFAMHGSPASRDIQIAVGEQALDFTTKSTGSFHTFTFQEVGTLSFDKAGSQTLTFKPAKGVSGSVMDLRQVILLPVLK